MLCAIFLNFPFNSHDNRKNKTIFQNNFYYRKYFISMVCAMDLLLPDTIQGQVDETIGLG